MIELPAERQVNAKTFDNGDGTRTLRSSGLVHVPSDYAAWKRGDPVTFADIDHTWEADGQGGWRLESGWFSVAFHPARFAITTTWTAR